MKSAKYFMAVLLCVVLQVQLALAQQATNSTVAQDVTIIIQQEQVRFTALKAVEGLQLQVFDQTGAIVYDSGFTTGAEINWPLQGGNGEALKSGLYAYRLSIKEAQSETSQLRRGHFIVDRSKDRDAKGDKLWITSQNSNGVGTELTVARDDETTIAGTTTVNSRAGVTERNSSQREIESKADAKSTAKSDLPSTEVAGSGTAGQIAKFTSGTDLGASVITEKNGSIGIGTNAPLSKLSVQTNGYGITQTNGAVTLGSFISSAAGGSGWFGTKSPHPLNFFTYDSLPRMTIDISGNVGIGTTAPTTKLHVLNTIGGTSAIFGESATGPGVTGKSTSSRGVYGESQSFIGVWGKSTSNSGVFGETAVSSLTAAGVYGKGTGSGSIGVIGESNLDNAVGVFGVSTSPGGVGVYARNNSGGRAVFAEGNVAQDLASNGLVKAMLNVQADGTILRCYNGITNSFSGNCGFVITQPRNGIFRIDFGFLVSNRFVSVTGQFSDSIAYYAAHTMGANYRFFNDTSVEVFTFAADVPEDTLGRPFMIILY